MRTDFTLSMPRFRRLVYIHQQISEGRFPNCSSLARDLQCSVMTIHRDKDVLTDEFMADIEFNPVKKGFYYAKPFSLPLLETINQKEIEILAAAKTLLSHYKNTPIYDRAEELINTLCACGCNCGTSVSGNGTCSNDFSLINRIAVAPVVFSSINEDLWQLISIAMAENRVISFDYKNSDWDPDLDGRTVRPYQIVLEDGKCLLFGFLEEKDDVRLFHLSKMSDVVILPRHFQLPEVYEFEKLCGGGKFGAFTRFEPKKYKIAFYEAARQSVRDRLWAEDQVIEEDDDNDCTIITFTSCQDMRILDWVFANKAYAVPLEPPEFVKRWKYNIKVMAEEAGIVEPDGVGFFDYFPEEKPE